jgi:hypothetical protein
MASRGGVMDKSDVHLWLRWVAANGVGGLLAFPAGGLVIGPGTAAIQPFLSDAPRPPIVIFGLIVWLAVWPAITGAGVAAAQWVVLRHYLEGADTRGWIRMNAILWLVGTLVAGIGAFLGFVAFERLGPDGSSLAIAMFSGLMIGVVVGIGQWSTLEDHSPEAWIWLPATPLGYVAGAGLASIVLDAALRGPSAREWVMILITAPALGGAVGGCVSGAITGLALVRLVRFGRASGR